MDYYSLHNHDYASNVRFLDSINKPELMIKKAIALGYKGMAFTNHECLSDEVELLHIRDSLKETHPDFKIIFGNEIYLIDAAKVKADPAQKYYHFILIAKDAIGYDQRPHKNRLMIAVPLFVVGVALNFIPFGMLWRYFGFANQALAAIMLWAAAAYLLHRGKFHWIASVPACFMTAVSAVYICFEKTMGFGMSYELSNIVGIAIALICFALLLTAGRKVQPTDDLSV